MIEFKNVYKKYDNGTEALKNVNLRIERGEFVFIVGASGSGKSTFLKTIMREEVPTSGTIMINNYDLTKMTNKEIPYFRRTMGIVFQDFRLIPNMNVYDNVAFAMRVIGANEKDIRKRVPYVLSLVGLQNKARSLPNEISGGEQQRVALARALVNNANTIIADEPTGNIDPEMSYEIVDLLNHINENGTTVIMVTHEHELVKKFNHRIVVIDHGTVVSDTAAGSVLNYETETGYRPADLPVQQGFVPNSAPIEIVERPEPVQRITVETTAKPSPAVQPPVQQGQPQAQQVQSPAQQVQPPVQQAQSPSQQVQPTARPVQSPSYAPPVQTVPNAQSAVNIPEVQPGTVSEVFTIPVSNNVIGSPLSAAKPNPPVQEKIDDFRTIDGIDYSKYFEDTDGEV